MSEQIQQQVVSSFVPFLDETRRLMQLKDRYHELLAIPGWTDIKRYSIIAMGKQLIDESARVLADYEKVELDKIILKLEGWDQMVTLSDVADMGAFNDQFGNESHIFIQKLNEYFQIRGLGLKVKEDQNEIDRAMQIFEVKPFWKNSYGIAISWQLDMFARILHERLGYKMDNSFIVDARVGKGKSTFTLALATTLAEYNKVPFTVAENVFFNEKREFIFDKIRKDSSFGTPYIFDEAGNQVSKKTWWLDSQIELMNQGNLDRFIGLSQFYLWDSSKNLDIQLRDFRVHGVISIPQRGIAMVKVPNLNPSARTAYQTQKQGDSEVVLSAQNLTDFINNFDKNKILEIPFYDIDHVEMWTKDYLPAKNDSFRNKRMMKLKGQRSSTVYAKSAEAMYKGLLMSIPDDQSALTFKEVEDYSKKINYSLSYRKLLQMLHEKTGVRQQDILDYPTIHIMNKSQINIDNQYVRNYINKLKNTEVEGDRK